MLGDRHSPLLSLAEASLGRVAGQSASGDEQIGGATEAIAADQGELQQNVSRGLAEAPVCLGSLVDQVEVDPVRRGVDCREEVAQVQGSGLDSIDTIVEGLMELRHRHLVIARRSHRLGESGASLVPFHESLADQRHLLLIDCLYACDSLEDSADLCATLLGCTEASWGSNNCVDGHAESMTRAIARIQFAYATPAPSQGPAQDAATGALTRHG